MKLSASLKKALTTGFVTRPDAGEISYEWHQESNCFQDLNRPLNGPSAYENQIKALEERFDSQHNLVRRLLHHPDELLSEIDKWSPTETQKSPLTETQKSTVDNQKWWIFTCYAEALWSFLHSDASTAPCHRRFIPLAARIRFLALSQPFRFPCSQGWDDDHRFTKLFEESKDKSTVQLTRRARSARDTWHGYLDDFQAFTPFNNAAPHALEEELNALTFADGEHIPLQLVDYSRENPAAESPDHAVNEVVVERHLLPRFAIWSTIRMVRYGNLRDSAGLRRTRRIGDFLYGIVVLLSIPVAIGYTAFAGLIAWPLWPGAVVAVIVYLAIGVGSLRCGRLWAMPLMLRLPAASALGLIILIALPPDWWKTADFAAARVCTWVVLAGAAFGYLLIECRNHNPGQLTDRPWRALGRLFGRSLAVFSTGIVHSVLVALIGLSTIVPAFTADGAQLHEMWATGAGAQQMSILITTTLSCLTVGVFSQILWDDQPITAPLAHRRWRSER